MRIRILAAVTLSIAAYSAYSYAMSDKAERLAEVATQYAAAGQKDKALEARLIQH